MLVKKSENPKINKQILLHILLSALTNQKQWTTWFRIVDNLETDSILFNVYLAKIKDNQTSGPGRQLDPSSFTRIFLKIYLEYIGAFLSEIEQSKKLGFCVFVFDLIYKMPAKEYSQICRLDLETRDVPDLVTKLEPKLSQKARKAAKKMTKKDNSGSFHSKSIVLGMLGTQVDLLRIYELQRKSASKDVDLLGFYSTLEKYEKLLRTIGLDFLKSMKWVKLSKERDRRFKSAQRPFYREESILEGIFPIRLMGICQENSIIWEQFEIRLEEKIKKIRLNSEDTNRGSQIDSKMQAVHLQVLKIFLAWLLLKKEISAQLVQQFKSCIFEIIFNVSNLNVVAKFILQAIHALAGPEWFRALCDFDLDPKAQTFDSLGVGFLLMNWVLGSGNEELLFALGDQIMSEKELNAALFHDLEHALGQGNGERVYMQHVDTLRKAVLKITKNLEKNEPKGTRDRTVVEMINLVFEESFQKLSKQIKKNRNAGSWANPEHLFSKLKWKMQLNCKARILEMFGSENLNEIENTKSTLRLFVKTLQLRFLNLELSKLKTNSESEGFDALKEYFSKQTNSQRRKKNYQKFMNSVRFDLLSRMVPEMKKDTLPTLFSKLCPEITESKQKGINLIPNQTVNKIVSKYRQKVQSELEAPNEITDSITDGFQFSVFTVSLNNLVYENKMKASDRFSRVAENVGSVAKDFACLSTQAANKAAQKFLKLLMKNKQIRDISASVNLAMANIIAIGIGFGKMTPFGVFIDDLAAAERSSKTRPVFFCNFQDVIGIVSVNKGQNQITKWYKCRKCLTPFGVGNCGQTIVEKPCSKCGQLVGGRAHKTNSNTIELTEEEIDTVQKLARVRYHPHRPLRAVSQNFFSWEPEVFRFWHCLLHVFFLGLLRFGLASEGDLTDYLLFKSRKKLKLADDASKENKKLLVNGLKRYLIEHIHNDLDVLGQLIANSVDSEKLFGLLIIELAHELSSGAEDLQSKISRGSYFHLTRRKKWFRQTRKAVREVRVGAG